MAERRTIPLGPATAVTVCFTDVEDGDFRVREPRPGLTEDRNAIHPGPWSWIRQVHEAAVLSVDQPGQHAGAVADGLLTTTPDCPIAVTTADCAPVVLVAERGVATVHAGWRGLLAGIVEEAGRQLTVRAGQPVATLLGPCIGPEDYEFGDEDLAVMTDRFGPTVAGRTGDSLAALDVPAAVAVACSRAGWPVPDRPPSTSDPRWFSHRTRGDLGRQTAVAWLHRTPETADGTIDA